MQDALVDKRTNTTLSSVDLTNNPGVYGPGWDRVT